MASRWWAVAIAIVVAVCALILGVSWADAPLAPVAAAVLAAFVLVFVVVGRRAVEGSVAASVFIVMSVVTTFALVSVAPPLAVFQSIAMPAGWVLARGRRGGVLASAAVALAAGAGFFVALGPSWDTAATAAITILFSFVGSVALGLWIWRIADYGEERARLLAELTAAQGELAALHRDAGGTAERERLSRELHDTIAQSLAGLVLLAQRSRREQAAGTLGPATLELVEDAARAALTETRALVAGSAPVDLGGGLADALDTLAARFRRETEVEVTVAVAVRHPLDREAEVALLRSAQEGLANVRKHAGARRVTLELAGDEDVAVLRVVDDGRGFAPDSAPDGFGLSGLRARLALVGGDLTIDGTSGATTLTARVPRSVA